MKPLFLIGVAACFLASGCDDSKNPLSDPKTSKADERLVGVWRQPGGDGDDSYVGHAGERFPNNVMRIVVVNNSNGELGTPDEYLAFTTVIGDKTYLNLVRDGDNKVVTRLDREGWKAAAVDCYTFLRYKFDGDKLVMWIMDEQAMQKAIQSGKIKGVTKPFESPLFTDSTANLARFVAEAGDSLWNTKEPFRFERVNASKKP
jgi:hypothetical protein